MPDRAKRTSLGVVVADPLPLFRAGALEALTAAGLRVLGACDHLSEGLELARKARPDALLLGGASVAEMREAVEALPGCAVVVLLAQPTRGDLVEVLSAGVAGMALRSLTAEELVGTVQAAVEAGSGEHSGGRALAGGTSPAPVFLPLPVSVGPSTTGPGPSAEEGAAVVLTSKEREVLAYLAQGASNKRIAEALYVTPATVKTHLAHIYAKLGARGRHEALSHALAAGLFR